MYISSSQYKGTDLESINEVDWEPEISMELRCGIWVRHEQN
jgi:hypothetical protein